MSLIFCVLLVQIAIGKTTGERKTVKYPHKRTPINDLEIPFVAYALVEDKTTSINEKESSRSDQESVDNALKKNASNENLDASNVDEGLKGLLGNRTARAEVLIQTHLLRRRKKIWKRKKKQLKEKGVDENQHQESAEKFLLRELVMDDIKQLAQDELVGRLTENHESIPEQLLRHADPALESSETALNKSTESTAEESEESAALLETREIVQAPSSIAVDSATSGSESIFQSAESKTEIRERVLESIYGAYSFISTSQASPILRYTTAGYRGVYFTIVLVFCILTVFARHWSSKRHKSVRHLSKDNQERLLAGGGPKKIVDDELASRILEEAAAEVYLNAAYNGTAVNLPKEEEEEEEEVWKEAVFCKEPVNR